MCVCVDSFAIYTDTVIPSFGVSKCDITNLKITMNIIAGVGGNFFRIAHTHTLHCAEKIVIK